MCGAQCTLCIVWGVGCGVWCVVCGVECGVWFVACGVWCVEGVLRSWACFGGRLLVGVYCRGEGVLRS